MPQSLSQAYLHLVFSTKDRHPWISPSWECDLWAYVAGAGSSHGCQVIKVGGVEDHLHVLIRQSRTRTIADLVSSLKVESSKWVKANQQNPLFCWQFGYGAFSVSQSNVDAVIDYIASQREHHAKHTFQDEFRALLSKHKVAWDERYVWD